MQHVHKRTTPSTQHDTRSQSCTHTRAARKKPRHTSACGAARCGAEVWALCPVCSLLPVHPDLLQRCDSNGFPACQRTRPPADQRRRNIEISAVAPQKTQLKSAFRVPSSCMLLQMLMPTATPMHQQRRGRTCFAPTATGHRSGLAATSPSRQRPVAPRPKEHCAMMPASAAQIDGKRKGIGGAFVILPPKKAVVLVAMEPFSTQRQDSSRRL